jgi:acyl dehydratase
LSTQEWIDPYAGFVYQEDDICIEAAYQEEKLQSCGIDPQVFGDQADPSFFIGLAIHAGIKSGITAQGNINMLQQLTQHRPVRLGETLRVTGQIADVRPVPRGRTLHSEVQFSDVAGEIVITANRVSLKPDPTKAGVRGAGEKPAPLVSNVQAGVTGATYTLTPAGVKAYSSEGNSIHYEEEAARKAGFRAPLIGGGMGVHYLMAALWRTAAPQSFHAEIYFRRPIFWDETVTVWSDQQPVPEVMALLIAEDKVGTELALLAHQPQG